MEEDKFNDIRLRSEQFQDILGEVPSWILRWGIVVIAFFILLLLVGSAVFKYPDIISCELTLTGGTPSAVINAKSSGRIAELFVNDNQSVTEGEYLGIIENPASTPDIMLLKEYLEDIDMMLDSLRLPPKDLKLATMQPYYSSLYLALSDLIEYKKFGYFPAMSGMLSSRIDQYEELHGNMRQQKAIVGEQLKIMEDRLVRDSLLNAKGLLSAEDLSKARDEYLQKLLSLENIEYTMLNTHMQLIQMRETILESRYQDAEKITTLGTQVKTLAIQLKTEIESWEQDYVLKSPVQGRVSFTRYWALNQNVTMGETVLNVLPDSDMELLGKALLPITRSGKVKVGQRVNIRFDNFPDEEYGFIIGEVLHMSLIPYKDANQAVWYSMDITFPSGLKTTYGKELPFLPDMTGRADIITEDISVLQRFFMPLRKALDKAL